MRESISIVSAAVLVSAISDSFSNFSIVSAAAETNKYSFSDYFLVSATAETRKIVSAIF